MTIKKWKWRRTSTEYESIWSLMLGNPKQISCCFYDPAKEKKETPRFRTSNLQVIVYHKKHSSSVSLLCYYIWTVMLPNDLSAILCGCQIIMDGLCSQLKEVYQQHVIAEKGESCLYWTGLPTCTRDAFHVNLWHQTYFWGWHLQLYQLIELPMVSRALVAKSPSILCFFSFWKVCWLFLLMQQHIQPSTLCIYDHVYQPNVMVKCTLIHCLLCRQREHF